MSKYINVVRDGHEKTISKLTRKINQLMITHEHIHERLARLTSSTKNQVIQIRRLKRYLENHNICDRCGDPLEMSREVDEFNAPVYYMCDCGVEINSDLDV